MSQDAPKYYLSKSDIKTLRQLRNLLSSINLKELDAILERAEGKQEPQPRKRANLKAIRKEQALQYLLGNKSAFKKIP